MALSRLRARTRQRDTARYVQKTALIVGGGPAGLSAANTLAELQQKVVLVEKQDVLGGNLSHIYDPALNATIKALRNRVENHSNITVCKSSEIISNYGLPGNFISRIRIGSDDEKILNHGITILATGGGSAETDAYGLASNTGIITQFELERQLYDPELLQQPPKSVVMIQCAGSREEPNNYCSRICCLKTLKNALKIKEMQPDAEIYVFYRDIMTYGDSEKVYTEARKQGILFVPFDVNRRPLVKVEDSKLVVSTYDPILGSDLRLRPDVVVLAVGVVPNSIEKLAQTFSLETTRDGFFQEADSKWRPVDSGREGVFIAGLGKAPVRAEEAMREGKVAAFRALRILEKDILVPQRLSARVRHAICSRCELCIETCSFGARYVDPEQGMIMVDHAACQGCGACAAVCPNGATLTGDFEDDGIMNAIEAAL
jgi:heterodisulfide reductase subunit A